MITKHCNQCFSEFKIYPSGIKRKFCSHKCYGNSLVKGLVKTCKFCKIEYKTYPSKNSKYCSQKCNHEDQKTAISKICEFCGKQYKAYICHEPNKYCSFKCYKTFLKDFWGGGKATVSKYIRNSLENLNWRKKVFERDDYTCQECFKRGCELHVHHIKKFSIILKEFLNTFNQFSQIEDKEILSRLAINYKPFWDINNGKTLCVECHIKTIKKVLVTTRND